MYIHSTNGQQEFSLECIFNIYNYTFQNVCQLSISHIYVCKLYLTQTIIKSVAHKQGVQLPTTLNLKHEKQELIGIPSIGKSREGAEIIFPFKM